MSKSFSWKLYWRQRSKLVGTSFEEFPAGLWHCFEKVYGPKRFVSLCGEREKARSGGGKIFRPHAMLRCPMCDVYEMRIRGWEESGPQTANGVHDG